MVIKSMIEMDIARRRAAPCRVDAVQDDKYSREVEIELYSDGGVWYPPQDALAVIRYTKMDGKGGCYDTLPDGSAAYTISGNALTVRLAPQALTVPGPVYVTVSLLQGSWEINTFAFYVDVQRRAGGDLTSENYLNLHGILPAGGWSPRMFLGTDESGNVVEVSPMQPKAYLCGGVEVPVFPEYDKEKYGHMYIFDTTEGAAEKSYRLNFSSAPYMYGVVDTVGSNYYGIESSEEPIHTLCYHLNAGQWVKSNDWTANYVYAGDDDMPPIWASTDILAEDGSVKFPGSKPVPVYAVDLDIPGGRVEVDPTLSVPGMAADAAQTGEAIKGAVKSVDGIVADETGNVDTPEVTSITIDYPNGKITQVLSNGTTNVLTIEKNEAGFPVKIGHTAINIVGLS